MTDTIIELVAGGYFKMSLIAVPFMVIYSMIRYFIIER